MLTLLILYIFANIFIIKFSITSTFDPFLIYPEVRTFFLDTTLADNICFITVIFGLSDPLYINLEIMSLIIHYWLQLCIGHNY